MNKEKILGWTPLIELFIRNLYYSDSKILQKIITKTKKKKKNALSATYCGNQLKWIAVQDYIKNLPINQGDVLIVHSSTDEMLKVGAMPQEVISFLFELIGEAGTLVVPCFPLYDNKNFDTAKGAYTYNPKRTVCSTGLIPNIFVRMNGVIRSTFPWNTLAAKGPLAASMMEHNLETDLAHGKGSSWEFCMNHNAKILLLGVKASHTTTMVHVAEDVLDERWPVDDWYEQKKFFVKDDADEKELSIRVRKQHWAKYNASWYRSCQLKKENLLQENVVEGLNVGFVKDSKAMVDYIEKRALNHKPFFVVPKRCYKK